MLGMIPAHNLIYLMHMRTYAHTHTEADTSAVALMTRQVRAPPKGHKMKLQHYEAVTQ